MGLFKIGPQCIDREPPVTSHPYHLRSWSCRCSSSPTALTPTLSSSATRCIRLPQRLSTEIWDNYSSSEELGTPQPFTPSLFNSPVFAQELHVSLPPWSLHQQDHTLLGSLEWLELLDLLEKFRNLTDCRSSDSIVLPTTLATHLAQLLV